MPFAKHSFTEREASNTHALDLKLWCKELHCQAGQVFVLEQKQKHFKREREKEKGAGDRDDVAERAFYSMGSIPWHMYQ